MQQNCWACGSVVTLAEVGGVLVPLFKCGWCGALNSPVEGGDHHHAAVEPTAPHFMLTQPRRCRPLPQVAGSTLVAILLLVLGSVFVLGLSLVLPALVGPVALAAFHLPLAALLVFNIFFNYIACATRHPGPVQQHLQRTAVEGGSGSGGSRVQQGGLEGCRYCELCCYYKPAEAHHCRSCGLCVMQMDHHCWYINNCVGAANLRHFLLLLGWVMAGAGYGLALGLTMGWKDRRVLLQYTRSVLQSGGSMHRVLALLSFSMRWLLSAPFWMACWAYFTAVCWAALLSVGRLFWRQVQLLLRGRSYLDTLRHQQQWHQQQTWHQLQWHQQQMWQQQQQRQPGAAAAVVMGAAGDGEAAAAVAVAGVPTESPAMRNARRVFGSGHPVTWVLPAWDVQPAPPCERPKRC